MRILFVFDRYEVGGIVSFLDNLTAVLVRKGVEVILLGGKEERKYQPRDVFVDRRIKKNWFKILGKSRWQKDFSLVWESLKSTEEILRHHKVDLVVFNNSGSGLGTILAPLSWNIPKIYQFHGAWDIEEESAIAEPGKLTGFRKLKTKARLSLYHLAEIVCLKAVTRVLVLSKASAELLSCRFGAKHSAKTEVLTPGVDTDFLKPSKKIHIGRQIFNLSRYDPKKGLDNLLKAAQILKNKGFKFHLVIAGLNEKNQEKVKKRRKGLGNFLKLKGYLNKEEKRSYYQSSELFILPSVGFEAYPTVIMEAMACGLPVVATPVGGVPDMLSLVDKRLLVGCVAPEDLAKKMAWFLGLNQKEKEKISFKARTVAVEHWDMRKQAEEMLKKYQELIK